MDLSLNCLFLGETSFNDVFTVEIREENIVDNGTVAFKNLAIAHLKFLIWDQRKKMLGIDDPSIMKLWKVNITEKEGHKLEYLKEDNIKQMFNGEFLKSHRTLESYFPTDQGLVAENIHIIAHASDYPNKRPGLDFNEIPLDLNRPPTQLLFSSGLSWAYQESPEMEKVLKGRVRELYNVYKVNKRDKITTPIFLMTAGGGCGKSRNATEFPKVLNKIFANDPELEPCLQEALTFNVSFENDTRIDTSMETNANSVIAKRMFYQIQSSGLQWTEIRDDTGQSPTILNILKRCAKQKNVELKKLAVILIVDGMQNALINDDDGNIQNSLFNSLMTEISILVTNNESPLVIACCTSSLSGIFIKAFNSPQYLISLPIRTSLDPPKFF
ncbi:hypothetical protein RclHR1_00060034 [Rhizophagus clarus]|uniref:Crinkler (CRN) family protein, putative n=1 Tax=Rhizophagus clarus TaxID=94130 RepID=A0A2Z6RRZ0_9GLOM|nr:hypothetical protein RclHR1_00060034 [Rhizophagus clarus]GES82178.1 crinkler (CRN) family protein, putative [Rhizophagus clarus]